MGEHSCGFIATTQVIACTQMMIEYKPITLNNQLISNQDHMLVAWLRMSLLSACISKTTLKTTIVID